MKSRGPDAKRGGVAPALALSLAILAGTTGGLAAELPWDIGKGDVEVTTLLPGGKKFERCTVYVRDQVFNPAAPGEKVLAREIKIGDRLVVTADAVVGKGESAKRYVGVTEAFLEPNKTVGATVSLEPVADIDLFCRGCHPSKGERMKKGQIIRDLHVSGKEIPGGFQEQVQAYNARVEQARREGKPAGEPIVLDERIVLVRGKKVKKIFYTCESCHTLHATSANRSYARAAYREKSDLCLGCHK